MEKRLEEPLRTAVDLLAKNGYRYAVIGGLALARWGRPRITKDVDIKVLVPDLNYQKIRSLLTSSFPKTARLQAPTNPFIVARIIDDIIVDFMLAIPVMKRG